MKPEEPRQKEELPQGQLDYSHLFDRWQGEAELPNGILLVWMDRKTFERYVTAYLEQCHITEPTYEQHEEAIAHCQPLSFWLVQPYDPDVHIRRFGEAAKYP